MRGKATLDHILKLIPTRRILLRTNFDVHVQNGKVKEEKKIFAAVPTIRKLLDSGANSITIISHMNHPDGKHNPEHSLKPVAKVLEELLARKIIFLEDCIGADVQTTCKNAQPGSIIMLENLRFHPQEQGFYRGVGETKVEIKKDIMRSFGNFLSSLGDIYVNDAFGASHTNSTSITGVDIPIRVAGLLMKKELEFYKNALEHPNRPLLLILGGVRDMKEKIERMEDLLDKVDEIALGGGVAFTFLKNAKNVGIGGSVHEREVGELVNRIMKKATEKGVKIHLPVDIKCAKDFEDLKSMEIVGVEKGVPRGYKGFDFGLETVNNYNMVIQRAKTIIWNGPLGAIESETYEESSLGVLTEMIRMTQNEGVLTIAGGKETNALIESEKAEDKLSHVSTGGKAFLELLKGNRLPGVEHLSSVEELREYGVGEEAKEKKKIVV